MTLNLTGPDERSYEKMKKVASKRSPDMIAKEITPQEPKPLKWTPMAEKIGRGVKKTLAVTALLGAGFVAGRATINEASPVTEEPKVMVYTTKPGDMNLTDIATDMLRVVYPDRELQKFDINSYTHDMKVLSASGRISDLGGTPVGFVDGKAEELYREYLKIQEQQDQNLQAKP